MKNLKFPTIKMSKSEKGINTYFPKKKKSFKKIPTKNYLPVKRN